MNSANQYRKTLIARTLTTLLIMLSLFSATLNITYAADDEKEILYWIAPMDPNYRRDQPGKSPMGMDLTPVYKNEDSDGSSITISSAVIQNMGVRTLPAERTQLWRGIDTVGYVDYDESLLSHIHLRTQGWIENLVVKSEGDRVKKGQRLFDLYSPELVNAQEEFVSALSSGSRGLAHASKERLVALGISDDQINTLRTSRKAQQRISIYATQNGVVSNLSVREGMFVKPEMRIMSLGDLSSVWLLAEVFERQVEWLEAGQPAEVKLSFVPGKAWEGKVEYIYPGLDPITRTLKVRLRFDNPGEQLKPNMYANVKIYAGATKDTIVIPIEGLIRTGRNDRVIVSLGDGKFDAREVAVGIESGDYVEIVSGIDEGEKIVVSGQFLLDSEASTRASFTRMSDTPATAASTTNITETKTITGTGVIEAVLLPARKLKIQHNPISELGWPAMSMQFGLAPDIDLSNLVVGEKIMFQLEQSNDRYLITSIHNTANMPVEDREQSK